MLVSTNTDWKYGVLEDAVTKGSSNISHDKIKEDDGPYPVFGAKGYIQNISFYQQEKDYIAIIKDGAGIGRVSVHPDKSSVLATMQYLLPNEGFDLRFIKYFLESLDFEKYRAGSTIPHIYFKDYKSTPFPLISIPEQKRIVAILDQAFAEIEQARAKTEKNLKNARELFESYLQQVFSQRGDEVQNVELGEVVDVLTDYHANGSYKVLKQHVELKEEENFAWMVRSTDFEKKFKNHKRFITEHAYNYLTKSKLFGGEIIMSKIGNAGKVYFMPETDRPCSLAMNLFLIRLNSSKANNEYIYRYLNSGSGKAQIAPRLKGAATQTITKDNVRSLQIPMPSLDRQREVVETLRKLEKEVEPLESLYKDKLAGIEELKQSILQKAFSGDLTKEKEGAAA
jgi:type I restriction enzyme S subunit